VLSTNQQPPLTCEWIVKCSYNQQL